MTTWYSVTLGDGVEAFPTTKAIQEAFIPIYGKKNMPADMAVFTQYNREANVVTAYFTPAAKEVAEIINAQPCDAPDSTDMEGDRMALLVGDQRAIDEFFPEGLPGKRI